MMNCVYSSMLCEEALCEADDELCLLTVLCEEADDELCLLIHVV